MTPAPLQPIAFELDPNSREWIVALKAYREQQLARMEKEQAPRSVILNQKVLVDEAEKQLAQWDEKHAAKAAGN